jgi:ribonuclease D
MKIRDSSGSVVSAMSRVVACCLHADLVSGSDLVNADGPVRVARADLPAQMMEAFSCARRVAWDVETSGLDWRRERLATCQLFAEDIGVVVITLDGGKPDRLAALLENPGVEKVFHHAPFDLRFMIRAWEVRPVSIRCTKVASKLLQPEAPNKAHTLEQLVARHMGVELSKGPVRTSDWAVPDLTPEQIEYAARDVLHLPDLLDVLTGALQMAGLTRLYEDCCAFLPARTVLELGGYPDVFAY